MGLYITELKNVINIQRKAWQMMITRISGYVSANFTPIRKTMATQNFGRKGIVSDYIQLKNHINDLKTQFAKDEVKAVTNEDKEKCEQLKTEIKELTKVKNNLRSLITDKSSLAKAYHAEKEQENLPSQQ